MEISLDCQGRQDISLIHRFMLCLNFSDRSNTYMMQGTLSHSGWGERGRGGGGGKGKLKK